MIHAEISVHAERTYQVGVAEHLPELLRAATWTQPGRRALLVCNDDSAPFAADVENAALDAGMEVSTTRLPRGEAAKTLSAASDLWRECARAQLDRGSIVVAVGGGTVTDAAGFAAATWMRGIDWVAVPTTTAGMVDAAIGGKTGINTDAGKNLVGSFHSPVSVLCATQTLASLPRADYVAGLVEALKCGFISDTGILELVTASADSLLDPSSSALADLITRAVRVKAAVVSADFTEQGGGGALSREVLNYGHTFGHALEAASGYVLRHGDAVAVGMVFAAELAEATGEARPGLAMQHRAALAALGAPTAHEHDDLQPLLHLMSRDKKARGGVLRFVLLRAPGHPVTADGVALAAVEQAFARTRESSP